MAVQNATGACACAVAGTTVTAATSSLFSLCFYAYFRCRNPEPLLPLSDVPNHGKHRSTGCTILLSLLLTFMLRCCYGVVVPWSDCTLLQKPLYSAQIGSPLVLLAVQLDSLGRKVHTQCFSFPTLLHMVRFHLNWPDISSATQVGGSIMCCHCTETPPWISRRPPQGSPQRHQLGEAKGLAMPLMTALPVSRSKVRWPMNDCIEGVHGDGQMSCL